jgi:putative transposase
MMRPGQPFRQWLEYFGFKYGKATVAVPPHNTSQNCSNCDQKVPKSLSTRTHVCPDCGYVEDRDINAAYQYSQKGTKYGRAYQSSRLGRDFL